MKRILVSDGMDSGAFAKLVDLGYEVVNEHFSPEELKEQIKEFDAIIVRSATKLREDTLKSALEKGRLKLIVRGGVGIDNIDHVFAENNGIRVRNTPYASSRTVAELAIGHMFAIARFLHISNVTMRQGQWNKKQYKGTELNGKTLGLIGFGRIGQHTAKIASAIGMKVLYNRRSGKNPEFEEFEYVSKSELLERSDFISMHTPFVKETGAVLKQEDFELMKDGVFIVNTSRGEVIDNEALLSALDSGKVAAAALDVFVGEPKVDERILGHDKISLSPHVGGLSKEAQQRIGQEIVGIIEEHFGSQELDMGA